MQNLTDYTKSESVSISDLHVEKIPQSVGKPFIESHHYTNGCGNAAMIWGLYANNTSELIGAIAFHTPISENARRSVFGEGNENKVTELHRMAIAEHAPHNTGSWLISRALDQLKEHKPQYKAVISFADVTEGHDGTVYQAANADYVGMTNKTTFYRDADGRLRAPRQKGENISKSEAKNRWWEVVKRESKHKYVFWLPDEYESKDQLREKSRVEPQPYP